ncbi:hypothetical protein PENTCL1PPCAC_10799, partial [Pristionchus entomophagus]
ATMADNTRVSEAEVTRREQHIRAGLREREVMDPFTWSYPFKGAALMTGVGLVAMYVTNRWNKKPYYYALFPRLAALSVVAGIGYSLGKLREHHYKTRDAVVEHYVSLHPEDFDHFKDRSGRSFSQIILPWYPRRAQYTKFE